MRTDVEQTNLISMLPLDRQTGQSLLLSLQIRYSFLSDALDIIEGLGVLCSFEDVVELLLEHRRLSERPIRVFLMTENHVLQHGFGNS